MNELIEAVKKLSFHDYYDWALLISTIIIPILTAIINVYVVNKNTNRQIANQNKETYKPRLRLKAIQSSSSHIGQHILYACSKNYENSQNEASKNFNIILENIGNGLANDISFYMLHNGEKCVGQQVGIVDRNQTLNSTIEIPIKCEESIPILISLNKEFVNPEKEYPNNEDFCLLICNYKDLNKNDYKILIGIIFKKISENYNYEERRLDRYTVNFDYYYYQEETEAYKNMVNKEQYNKKYKKILKEIQKKASI